MTEKKQDREKLSPFWAEAKRAADEVATWPASKRMETVYRLDSTASSKKNTKQASSSARSKKA
jgi:hypothetical protein